MNAPPPWIAATSDRGALYDYLPTHAHASEVIRGALETRDPVLDLSRIGLSAIPLEVFQMPWLVSLNLEGNSLQSIPDEIATLKELQSLNLRNNHGLQISDKVGELTQLHFLAIGPYCKDIPEAIRRCSNLEELAIGGNDLAAVPGWLKSLRSLQVLHLWGNRLQKVPDWWRSFPNLRILGLGKNMLLSLPRSLGDLAALEALDVSENNLFDLPTELGKLQNLKIAHLGGNRFKALPEVVTQWSKLEVLDLNSDKSLGVHTDESGTVQLRGFDVTRKGREKRSSLDALHPNLRNLTKLKALLLYGNPRLQLPDELLGARPKQGPDQVTWDGSVQRILDYYFRTRGGARPLNEAKLILLGWGGVGKTSLVNRLVHRRFDPSELRTEGIEVTSWSVVLSKKEHVRLNVWDFGGQEIMHATHQFFLTSRSLYLIVLSGRAGSADTDADYWLRIVSSFGPDSPVVIALNQIAKDPFDLDEVGLRQKYPNIRAFVRTDCAVAENGIGIDDLAKVILTETNKLEDLRVKSAGRDE